MADCLSRRDINAVAQTSSRFFHVFDDCLYRENWPSFALWWAAKHDKVYAARRAIKAGATGECRVWAKEQSKYYRCHCLTDTSAPIGLPKFMSEERGKWQSVEWRCTPLTHAIDSRSDGVIRLLLEMDSVDINHRGMWDDPPICKAVLQWCDSADSAVVKALLESEDIDPNAFNGHGMSPLAIAAKQGHLEVAQLLLDCHQVNPNLVDGQGMSPLAIAAQRGHLEVVRLLLDCHQVNPALVDRQGVSPFATAVRWGYLEIARLLLDCHQVNPALVDRQGVSPFATAVRWGYLEIARLLLDCDGVDPDLACGNLKRTPLSYAAAYDRDHWKEIMELLLSTDGVDPDSRDENGWTPLTWAVEQGPGCAGTAKLLLDTGRVDPNVRPFSDDLTPLNRSTRRGIVFQLLVGFEGVDLNAMSAGNTPLIRLIQYGNISGVKQMMDTGKV
ncbi:ankyrin repeat domain-containing protein, partial [Candidatus Bathyarchaeota archaeon]|nr:ankyrin repeat domain-containing protein [Candidatus Bathyarchaeota archaeon]